VQAGNRVESQIRRSPFGKSDALSGDWPGTVAEARRPNQVEPIDPVVAANLSWKLYLAHNYEETEREGRKSDSGTRSYAQSAGVERADCRQFPSRTAKNGKPRPGLDCARPGLKLRFPNGSLRAGRGSGGSGIGAVFPHQSRIDAVLIFVLGIVADHHYVGGLDVRESALEGFFDELRLLAQAA
jgi:hypothetical protein